MIAVYIYLSIMMCLTEILISTCLPSIANYFWYPVNQSTQCSKLLLVSCRPVYPIYLTTSYSVDLSTCLPYIANYFKYPVYPVCLTTFHILSTQYSKLLLVSCLPSLSNYFSYLLTCPPSYKQILSHFQLAHEILLMVKQFHFYRHCIRYLPYLSVFLLFISVAY